MPRISSPRPLDLTKPFVTSSQAYGSQPFDLSQNLVTWYRDVQGDFVPDLSGRGNNARCAGFGSHDRVTGSNDTPEYNTLNYPIKSFDLSDDSISASNVLHISSVNELGQRASLNDHTFTDSTRDIPFSVSFWVKSNSTSGAAQYIAAKGAISAGDYEWWIDTSNGWIRLVLASGGNITYAVNANKTAVISAGTWAHFVITYSGKENSPAVSIYKDGSDINATVNVDVGYTAMQGSDVGLCIGTAFSNTSYAVSTSDFKGKIHSFATWKNRVISSSEVKALYNAYINSSGGEARSGFISRSPRLHLRELDDLPGSYPTVRRTGDPTRTGALSSNFNDETSIVFSNAGNVVFPTMLPKGSSFASQAVEIIGQESDISASLPIRSFQQPNHLHYSPAEEMGPFDESSKDFELSSFYMTGTSESLVPGLSEKLSSKSIINLKFVNNDIHYVTRYSSLKGDALDPSGFFAGGDVTGFCYFNPTRRSWEDKGVVDVATGASRNFSTCVSYEKTGALIGSRGYNVPFQFSWSPNVYIPGSTLPSTTHGTLGYESIGHPTILGEAPYYGSVYHATASQVFSIGDRISSPFLLEKLTLSMNVGLFHGGGSNLRDIENYVVFLYRQSRRGSTAVDSADDISTSKRYLIASASICVIDSTACSALPTHSPNFSVRLPTNGSVTRTIKLEMIPAVVSPGLKATSRLIGSCSFYNGGGSSYPLGSSLFTLGGWPYRLPAGSGVLYNGFNDPNNPAPAPVLLQNFWTGGRTYSSRNTHASNQYFQGAVGLSGTLIPGPPSPSTHTGLNAAASPLGISNTDRKRENFIFTNDERDVRNLTGTGSGIDDDFDPSSTSTLTKILVDYDQVDRISAFPTAYRYVPATSDVSTVNESPYLLLPGDQLVLGIDAGIPADKYYEGNETSAFESPASYMVLQTGTININMYGSLIKDGKYVESTLNQDLSSNSIHEIIGAEPVLDQFMIEPRSSYYGSRLEEIVTGSMLAPVLGGVLFSTASQDQSRRVVSRVSLGQAGSTGSLQRFMKLSDRRERTYDSCLPSYADFLSGSSAAVTRGFSLAGYKDDNAEQVNFGVNNAIESLSFLPNQFPFEKNPNRNITTSGIVRATTFLYSSDNPDLGNTLGTQTAAVDHIFRVGYSIHQTLYGVSFTHRNTSTSVVERKNGPFRYGISNVKPEFSSSRWRSDRYGQLRDTLEQRQLVATFDGLKPVKISFVSGSTKVDSMLTHTQNLSTFATSSMPYFDDGVARNRPDNPDESLVEVIA